MKSVTFPDDGSSSNMIKATPAVKPAAPARTKAAAPKKKTPKK